MPTSNTRALQNYLDALLEKTTPSINDKITIVDSEDLQKLKHTKFPLLGDAAAKDVGTGAADVAAGDAPASAVSTHEAAHPIPTTRDDRNAAVSHSHLIADLPVAASGTSNTTQVVRADDLRLSNARTPTSHDNTAHSTNYEAEGTAAGLISTHAGNATAHHSNANDPTANEKAALAGTGTPSSLNKYVTDDDDRFTSQITSLTLTQTSWTEGTTYWEYVLSNVNITANSIVEIIPDNADYEIIQAAIILPTVDSSAGSVKIYAVNEPAQNIGITINIKEKTI